MNIFSYLRSRVLVLDVVSEYVALKPAGPYLKGRCPFHQEKDASFTVSPHREIFYCFGCHASGDVISFVARVEQCSQIEAARLIADKYNVQIPPELLHQTGPDREINLEKRLHYFDLCKAVAQWCQQQLEKKLPALTYVQSRKLTRTALELFDIGYFPNASIKPFLRAMQSKNFIVQDLLDAHILHEGKSQLYSPFEERIIFPIRDHMGRFCGFGGRTFMPNDTRAKYYNSQECAFFDKGSLLFGFSQAKKSIQEHKHAFLVEGYIDCVTMVEYGYHNTIATLGTACTQQHLKAVGQHADYLYVLFDADHAGISAMVRLTSMCWQANIEMRVIILPTGHDPASYLAAGNSLDGLIGNAQDIYRFFIEHQSVSFAQLPLKNKVKTAHALVNVLANVNDQIKQDILLQEAATALNISFQTLKHECKAQYAHHAPTANQMINQDALTDEIELSEFEQLVIAVVTTQPELACSEEADLASYACNDNARTIVQAIKQAHTSQPDGDLHMLIATLATQQQHAVHAALIGAQEHIESRDTRHVLRDIIRSHWRTISQAVAGEVKLAQESGCDERIRFLLDQLQKWKQNLIERSPR